MNVIDYIMITCNLKNVRLQITSDYMKKCNRLQLITITNYDYPMSGIDKDISRYGLSNFSSLVQIL
jgi:hypothetical protein